MANFKFQKNEFVLKIIDSLQMNPDDFFQNLFNNESYETIIFYWAISLYEEGKDVDEAIKIIFERRIKTICSLEFHSGKNKNLEDAQNFQKAMSKLIIHPSFKILYDSEKEEIKERVDSLVKTRLYNHPEIIQFSLKFINSLLEKRVFPKKECNGFSRDSILTPKTNPNINNLITL